MDNRVSDERLAELFAAGPWGSRLSTYEEVQQMMCELRDRRAAEREAGERIGRSEALRLSRDIIDKAEAEREAGMEQVSLKSSFAEAGREFSRRVDDLMVRIGEALMSNTVLVDKEVVGDDGALPMEPKLPKWARRLQEMGARLRWDGDAWVVYVPSERGDEVDAVFEAATPQAAVKLAWKEWRKVRSDDVTG